MFAAIQKYVHERRHGFIQSGAFLCGSYAISAYISERLEEMKEKMLRNKLARDSLRRRFQSTHDDVCFTIMALIPTLASQILEDMDVEALTNELQSISRASRSRTLQPSQNQERSPSVSTLSVASDVPSDAGSFSSYAGSGFDGDRASATFPTSEAQQDIPAQLFDSITSTSSSLSKNGQNTESLTTSTSLRTKSQLWNEVKILALTRSLTTLYTITLLSLLTAVQLNILGRSRYIYSVQESERAERARDNAPHLSLTEILAKETIANLVDVEAIWPAQILTNAEDEEENDRVDMISEETELRFLTLSWWVIHVGWKDVAARVRSSVEGVFNDVSLKNKLSSSELYTLIMDVRRRVEMDDTGSKLGERFLSTLLPQTPETTAHVLSQGGALSIPRGSELSSSGCIDSSLARITSPLFYDPARSSTTRHDVEPSIPPSRAPYDGLSRATALSIESSAPLTTAFPTPPSSHTHESDLISLASQSPPSSSVLHVPVPSRNVSNSLDPSHSAIGVDSPFNTLLAHTRRYLCGPDFAYALGCALDRATEVLIDGLRARVFVDSTSAVNVGSEEEQSGARNFDAGTESEKKDEVKIRLAGLLPGLSRWSQLALDATPNELVDNIMAVREVNALEAIIMTDYEDRFPAIS